MCPSYVHRMVTTLRLRLKDRDSRRFFGTYLAGKMLGLGAVLLMIYGLAWYFSTKAGAAMVGQDVEIPGEQLISPINTMWTLIAAFLVFFMQAGFMALEAGFARVRETSNILGGSRSCRRSAGLCCG